MIGVVLVKESEPDGVCSCGARRLNGHCTSYYWARGDELAALAKADREYLKNKEMSIVLENEVSDSRQPAPGALDTTPRCGSCGGARPLGSWPYCQDATGKHGHTRGGGGNLITAFHPSERTVVYCHPGKTGKDRYRNPARNDQPVPEVYARQGYVRMELESPRDVAAYEKETGLIHERTWCNPGSATAERSLLTGIEEAPKISGLDQAYGDRELLGHIAVG